MINVLNCVIEPSKDFLATGDGPLGLKHTLNKTSIVNKRCWLFIAYTIATWYERSCNFREMLAVCAVGRVFSRIASSIQWNHALRSCSLKSYSPTLCLCSEKAKLFSEYCVQKGLAVFRVLIRHT